MSGNFNHQSTADEVLEGINLQGKRALVTGGASGIGAETVRALAAKGAEVIIAARNQQQAEEVQGSVVAATGNQNVHIVSLDLASMAKVEAAAQDVAARFDQLDMLINNAGVMACPYDTTADGFELQFGSNHLGHFYLAQLLIPLLLQAPSARVVALTSMAHRMSPVVFEDINYQQRTYEKWQAYGQSKTANALFAVGLTARYADQGVEAFSVHPGAIATPLGRHLSEAEIQQLIDANQTSANNPEADEGGIKTVPQGAATSCYAATAAALTGKGGAYLEDCQIAQVVADDPNFRGGVRDYAIDPNHAEQLWSVSEELIGQKQGS